MAIMGKKREDGKYYLEGRIPQRVALSGKPEDIFTTFLIDSSQRITIVSESEATKHDVEYKSFNLKKNAIVKYSMSLDAYEVTDFEIIFVNNGLEYAEKFDKILIPIEENAVSNLEPSNVLGIDFLERFRISFLEPTPTSGGIILEKFQHPAN